MKLFVFKLPGLDLKILGHIFVMNSILKKHFNCNIFLTTFTSSEREKPENRATPTNVTNSVKSHKSHLILQTYGKTTTRSSECLRIVNWHMVLFWFVFGICLPKWFYLDELLGPVVNTEVRPKKPSLWASL